MDDEEKYLTDKLEEKQKELEELEKEKNPIRQKFRKIKEQCVDMKCLITMLLTALDNDFNIPKIEEIIDYLEILKNHLNNHDKSLDEFFEQLQLPEGKAKLISLSYHKFRD